MFEKVWEFFFGDEPEPEVKVKNKQIRKRRKKVDTTPITQYMWDFIMYAYNDWQTYNRNHPKERKNQDELVRVINEVMGTDKSRTALSGVWRGNLKREDLPKGEAYFKY